MLLQNPVLGLSVTGMLAVSHVVDLPVFLVVGLDADHRDQHEDARHQLKKNNQMTEDKQIANIPQRISFSVRFS